MLSSYLDIPPPPQRPLRFKTREQIENYLRAIKDYYDAFKIKLVRREIPVYDLYSDWNKSTNDNSDEEFNPHYYLLKKLYNTYKPNQPSRKLFGRWKKNHVS